MPRGSRSANGFSIVSAIFLLVTMTVLGVAMLRFTTGQQHAFVQDLEGAKAYRAARAGIEWGLYRLLRNDSCDPNVASTPQFAPGPSALGGALAGFSVSVKCERFDDPNTSQPYAEGGQGVSVFSIVSTASSGVIGTTSFVERKVQVTVER